MFVVDLNGSCTSPLKERALALTVIIVSSDGCGPGEATHAAAAHLRHHLLQVHEAVGPHLVQDAGQQLLQLCEQGNGNNGLRA